MSKKSRFGIHLVESRKWWNCDRLGWTEWTYEGRSKTTSIV